MNAGNFMTTMFGKIESGKCRLSANGSIAIKTSSGYKTYDVATGTLTNCDNFVFNIGDDMFFMIPTTKASVGDIIIVHGKPCCVINVEKNKIEVINYEDSRIETIIPERHVFMGDTYFYGKIVSMFGNAFNNKGKGKKNIFKWMLMCSMMNNGSNSSSSSMFGDSFGQMMLMSSLSFSRIDFNISS
jgi:hypothetical protein